MHKKLLIQAAACNLALLMRTLYGAGKPRAAHDLRGELAVAILRLYSVLTALCELDALLSQVHAGAIGAVFTRNLWLGMTGSDVAALQQFLISEASGAAALRLKAHGTSQYFGILTRAALKEFQKKVGIVRASGFFGPITRGWVNGRKQ